MLLRFLPLAGLSQAITWSVDQASQNLTVSWPATKDYTDHDDSHMDGGNNKRPAGGIFSYDSPANQIVNGTGSCDVTVATSGVEFIHFFDADVGAYDAASQKWTIHAMGGWEDQGSFSFVVMGDDEPVDTDLTIECQNDTPVPAGEARLSSFPRDIAASGTRGSFRIQGRDVTSDSHNEGEPATDYTGTVVLSFPVNSAPANFTVDDMRLAVEQTGDAFTISNLGFANFDDVWFEFDYSVDADGNRIVVASYEIDIQVI